ncbi:MAG: hypothetical protein NZM18_11960 [Thermoflexales bacterium]|nr:hypothetical protein [Thermoflexales bacterium]
MKGARMSFLALACVAGLIALSIPSYAEPARQPLIRVSMTVDAGFNSYVKADAWIPLRVTLTNAGDPIEGEVVVTNSSLATIERFAQPVSLGRNARRQVMLYAPPESDSLEVQLVSGQQVVASVTPVTRQLDPADRLVLVASDPPDALNFIGDVRAPNGSTSALALLRLDQFPDRVAALAIADVIILDGVDTSALSLSQRAAIRQWVTGGGHLILAGGPSAELTLSGLSEIAPGSPARALIEADGSALTELAAPVAFAPLAAPPSASVPVIRLRSAAPHVRTLAGSNETPLILRREVGRGIVDQLAFSPSLAPLRDWPGRAVLFARLFGGRVGLANDLGTGDDSKAMTFAAAALTAADPPSPLVVGGFFALYVLAIGPLNFFILRGLRRLSWAWVTVPAIVIAFTVLGLLTGFRLRGNQPHMHRLSVTLGDAATGDAQTFGIFGLFSPRNTEVTLEAGRALIRLVEPPRNPDEPASAVTLAIGEPSRVVRIPVTNSNVRTIYARDGGTLPPISAALRFIPGTANTPASFAGTIRNDTAHQLHDCAVLAGKDYQAIGDIAPGVTTDVQLNLLVGHPHSLPRLRTINTGRERLTGAQTFGFGAFGRSSRPSSSGKTVSLSGRAYPFEQDALPLTDALVNWQDFSDEPIRQDAQFGLVSAVFDAEAIGPGVYLGCWEWRDETGAQIAGADYTDRALRLWRLPVEQHLIGPGQMLPPDVFTWNIIATSASVELNDDGLLIEPGEHIIALVPWLDVRATGRTSRVMLNIEFNNARTSLDALRAASIALYNWQTRNYDVVVDDASDLAAHNAHTGPYLSSGGQIFIKLVSPTDSLTLYRLATTVEIPR